MGGGIGGRNNVGGYEHDPFLDTFLGPCGAGTNVRIALLQTMKSKEGTEAAEKDAELGLNFTIASNWKQAAKKKIQESNEANLRRPRAGFWDAQQPHGDSKPAQSNVETDRIWKQSAGGTREAPMLVFRGRTAADRRELSFASNPEALGKPYSGQDSRLFFSSHPARHVPALPPAVLASAMGSHSPASRSPSQGPSDPAPSHHPSFTAHAASPKLSISNIFAAVPSASSGNELHQHIGRQLSSANRGWQTDRPSGSNRSGAGRPQSGKGVASRPVSGAKSARTSSARSRRGLGEGVKGLQLPSKSFEEAPEEWHAFASRCFMAGDWETAKRALRALEIGDGIVGAMPSESMK